MAPLKKSKQNKNNHRSYSESQSLEHISEDIQRAIAKADKIDEALPMVKNLELNDAEMDDIVQTAKDTFKT